MESSRISFSNEVSLMMFGFGDSHKPNPETVRLVEAIVLQQLQLLVQEALKSSDKNELNGKELIFLMRHNKLKMRRFVEYLRNLEIKSMLKSTNIIEIDKDVKPKGELMKFIQMLDETGEFTDLSEADEIKQDRCIRADRISQALNEQKYLEFCKARTASFCSRDITYNKYDRIKLWIDPKAKITFDNNALIVLSYFAYQIVADITDYALLVRMDSKSGTIPFQSLSDSYYTSTMFNGEHRANEAPTKLDYSKIYTGQPPISPKQIKEVMRRLSCPQSGMLHFGKLPSTQYFTS